MGKKWGLTICTLFVALAFVSGCAKKTVLKEEITPQASAAPEAATVVKAPEKSALKDKEDAKKRAEQEWATKEAAAKEAAQEQAAKLKAAKEAAAVSSRELYEFADIHFAFDKFNLQDESRAILNKYAAWLNKNKDVKVTIEGHCDERGTAEYNLALGERRAAAAAKYLNEMGIDGKRIKAISYGFELPLDKRHNEEAWAKNRRAHFIVPSK